MTIGAFTESRYLIVCEGSDWTVGIVRERGTGRVVKVHAHDGNPPDFTEIPGELAEAIGEAYIRDKAARAPAAPEPVHTGPVGAMA